MKELKQTKYMNLLTTIAFFIGFAFIIWYSIFGGNYVLPIVGVIIIFVGRLMGYGIDRIIELKNNK
ncbi:MAG: hypothetical protein HFF36_08530 [Coprobacillus sp.]|nr:hypothetical protein [Coprobacillus sp.]